MNPRFSPLFKVPRALFKKSLVAIYPLVIKVWPIPPVLSIEDTIRLLIAHRMSIARFGDGEFLYIIDKLALPFQRYDERLAAILKEILRKEMDGLLVGLPSGYHGMINLNREGQIFWKSQISWVYPRLYRHLLKTRTYANASITRLYYEIEDKNLSRSYFSLMRSLWNERRILLIEGTQSRLGVGNDLFANATSVERILGPATHAFDKFDELVSAANRYASRDHLILVALGPTAKAVVYQLFLMGYQAIDIGNLDIEYEWFLKGAIKKDRVPGKYTSEAKGGRIVEGIVDPKYSSQILIEIGN